MINVLQFAPGFLFGGIESRMLDWYRNIDKEKVHFDLLKQNNNSNDTSKLDQLRVLGVNICNIPQFKYYNIISYCKSINCFFEDNSTYNVVHSHSVTTGLFVQFYAKKYGIEKRILHSRTTRFDGNMFRRIISRIMCVFAQFYATDFFACSEEAGRFAFGKKRKFTVINNGIQIEKFCFDYKVRDIIRRDLCLTDCFVIGCVCRFSKPKNFPFMIDVVMKLIQTDSTIKLLLVGDGSLKNYIENRFRDNNFSDKLIIVGEKDNVWDYYFAMDVFFSPSLWEGFGTTAIEAQATGLPCVVSDHFPPSTKITDYMFRVSLSDSIDLWTDTILKTKNYRRDEKTVQKIAEAGFDAIEIAKQLEIYYLS